MVYKQKEGRTKLIFIFGHANNAGS